MPHHFAVWRTSARCSDGYPYLSTFSAAQDARWPSPQADLTNMAILSEPKRQARSSCAIMHGLYVHHLPGAKPEVITSRAPATECLHAFVVRVWPLDPDSCQMVLVLDPPCRVPNRLPQGLLMGGDLSLELHTQPLGCVHAWGVAHARHSRVSVRNGPFRTIPDSLRSPQGFEMRVARPHRRFSTVENRSHPPCTNTIGANG